MTIDLNARQGRRGFLAAIAAAASGALMATMAGAQRVLAAGDDGTTVVVGGTYSDARSTTKIIKSGSNDTSAVYVAAPLDTGLEAFSQVKNAVLAKSISGTAIRAYSEEDAGVHAMSGLDGFARGVPAAVIGEVSLPTSASIIGNNYATSGSAQGMQGTSDSPSGFAVLGLARRSGTAIVGASGPDFPRSVPARTGVFGYAQNGRGGVFQGRTAQLRLVPSTADSHPTTGALGDLFLDKNKRLWFCKGGSTWKQLA